MQDEVIWNGNGFYLITYKNPSGVFLAYLDNCPSLKSTLEDCQNWKNIKINNAMDLSLEYPPQLIEISSDLIFYSLNRLSESVRNELGIKKEEIVTRPFLGGIVGFQWTELYKRWFAIEKKEDIWQYAQTYMDYLKEVLKKQKESSNA